MKNNHNKWRLNRIASALAVALLPLCDEVLARDVFNPALLEMDGPHTGVRDLSAYEQAGGQLPGTYRVDIYLNNEFMDTRDVAFQQSKVLGTAELQPCLTVDDLAEWGVRVSQFPELGRRLPGCADISVIPQAKSDFRFSQQRLLLSFPQAAVTSAARGWVDPKQWDDGVPALLLNYSFSGANNWSRQNDTPDSDNQYVNLRPGINVGPWRLRNYTTWARSSSGGESSNSWDTDYTYAQRNIKSLQGVMTLGDSSTDADVFEGVPFRGAMLASDDDMLPESLRGYAPVVRGIARTNAQVIIRQNGYEIYQTYVAPGAFEITDMYPTGGSGDLAVTIKEADGSEQNLIVPYASLPVLQREGRLKYSVTSGVYRAYDNSIDETPITQATAIYGLPWGLTLYGGGQFSSKYQSVALGMGKNLGELGAVSTDIIQAWSTRQDKDKESGQSVRLRYSKDLPGLGTNVSLAGYRYATSGYWDMQEVLDTYRDDNYTPSIERRRNRGEVTISQSLGEEMGSLSLSYICEDYWNTGRTMESVGVGYNNSWRGISYSMNYSYNRNTTDQNTGKRNDEDHLFALSISVPLGEWLPKPVYANYSLNSSKNGSTSNNLGLSGTLLERNNLSWSVQEGYTSQGRGESGSVNADWRATYAELTGGYSHDKYSHRLNYALRGGALVHENGLTLGQPFGETVALIKAPGAAGVGVNSQTGVRTDWRGYTVVPYASPYRKNILTLDTTTMPDNVDLELAAQTVVPTRGAVVRANYATSVGNRVLMTVRQENGQPLPFGAMVSVPGAASSEQAFIVGDGGQVYLTGLESNGVLNVKWGSGAQERCQIHYALPSAKELTGIIVAQAQCR
ncbi:fimbria/pilus outer membrane usher protein [Klebsiella michiganensis]|uniref:fimbria/pilus outer membrane usher protein n=1 Tax=Klebsiella michiganensis TaxID=1134687 RepID=UPI00227B24C5|nr:fimbria/pilus outer membrane usher protein [Klebsiella michiganensis]MCY3510832.1 fimbrial biogenesis outer membrane usher protein [Klebsiella michiganensis]